MTTKTRHPAPSAATKESTGYALRVETLKSGSFTFLSHVQHHQLAAKLDQLSLCQKIWQQLPDTLIESSSMVPPRNSSFGAIELIERLWQSQACAEESASLFEPSAAPAYSEQALLALELSEKLVRQASSKVSFEQIRLLHAAALRAVPCAESKPGRIRADLYRVLSVDWQVPGDADFQPPSYHTDLKKLCETLVRWHSRLVDDGAPVWLRAPLFSANLILLQPFFEANLRTARLLEYGLIAESFPAKVLPHISDYYANNALPYAGKLSRLASASTLSDKVRASTEIVAFFLDALISAYQAAHLALMGEMKKAVKSSLIQSMHQAGELNARQLAIFSQVQSQGCIRLSQLRKAAWYLALYESLTAKTKQRDLKKLYETEALFLIDKYLYAELPPASDKALLE